MLSRSVGADTSNDDKTYPQKPNNLLNIPMQVFFGGIPASISYRGRSQYPGLDQIVVTIPQNVASGCSVPVVVESGTTPINSNSASIPIALKGGACSNANSP